MAKALRAKVEASPCVLSIAGLDPGGGAGILADARAITRAGAFACAVCAVLTVQSTTGLREVKAMPAPFVARQARAVFASQRVRAVKVGALGGAPNVKLVAELAAIHKEIPFVVDPVIRPTRGSARLLEHHALETLKKELLPRSALVTANIPEAEALTKMHIQSMQDARDATIKLAAVSRTSALVKGGHLLGAGRAIDFLFLGGELHEIESPRIHLPAMHGGGCMLSSLIAGKLAVDERSYADEGEAMLLDAIRWAKKIHRRALETLRDVGGDLRVMV